MLLKKTFGGTRNGVESLKQFQQTIGVEKQEQKQKESLKWNYKLISHVYTALLY